MPLEVYKYLGLGSLKPTSMKILMENYIAKKPMGIMCDVLVRVESFIFPANFGILYCEVDLEVPIILERPFLTTGHALVDMQTGQMKF